MIKSPHYLNQSSQQTMALPLRWNHLLSLIRILLAILSSLNLIRDVQSRKDKLRLHPQPLLCPIELCMLLQPKMQCSYMTHNNRHPFALSVTCTMRHSLISLGMYRTNFLLDEFTDLRRSNDGLTLLMASTDGFCSTLTFAPGELGERYTGPIPTPSHPNINSTNPTAPAAPTSSSHSTPLPSVSPSLAKVTPVPAAVPAVVPATVPSPAPSQPPHFAVRPGSPTRSNSTSSIATMSSIQTPGVISNNPTPTMGHVPGLTAGSFAQSSGSIPLNTPPQTPMSTSGGGGGTHSATNSVSGSVLGKRDTGMTSESEKEDSAPKDGTVQKKRRIAPTLVSGGGVDGSPSEGPPSNA